MERRVYGEKENMERRRIWREGEYGEKGKMEIMGIWREGEY